MKYPDWYTEQDRLENKRLNRWYKVAWRRLDLWLHGQFTRGKKRRMLIEEKARLVHPGMDESQLRRLGEINYALGDGTPYRFTPQGHRLAKWVVQGILDNGANNDE